MPVRRKISDKQVAEILELWKYHEDQHFTKAYIGRKYGISASRVNQIIGSPETRGNNTATLRSTFEQEAFDKLDALEDTDLPAVRLASIIGVSERLISNWRKSRNGARWRR